MNPKDFDWTHDQTVTVLNPTEEDFRFQVHSKSYVIKAGSQADIPGYIAWVYVDSIAKQQASEKGHDADMIDLEKRKDWYAKYVVSAHDLIREVAPTTEEDEQLTVLGAPADDAIVLGEEPPASVEAPATGQTYESKFEKAAKKVRSSGKA